MEATCTLYSNVINDLFSERILPIARSMMILILMVLILMILILMILILMVLILILMVLIFYFVYLLAYFYSLCIQTPKSMKSTNNFFKVYVYVISKLLNMATVFSILNIHMYLQ